MQVSACVLDLCNVSADEQWFCSIDISSMNGSTSECSDPILFKSQITHSCLMALPCKVSIKLQCIEFSASIVISLSSEQMLVADSVESGITIGPRCDHPLDIFKQPMRGYVNYQITCKEVMKSIKCHRCLRVLVDPVSLSCKHIVCLACIDPATQCDETEPHSCCPVSACNNRFPEYLVEVDQFMGALLATQPYPRVICFNCMKGSAAIHCRACCEFFCSDCDVDIHEKSAKFFAKHKRKPMTPSQMRGLKSAMDDDPVIIPPRVDISTLKQLSDKRVISRLEEIGEVEKLMKNNLEKCHGEISRKFVALRDFLFDHQSKLFSRIDSLRLVHSTTLSEQSSLVNRYSDWIRQTLQQFAEYMKCDVEDASHNRRHIAASGLSFHDLYSRLLRLFALEFSTFPCYANANEVTRFDSVKLQRFGMISDSQSDDCYRDGSRVILPSSASFHQIQRTLNPQDVSYCLCLCNKARDNSNCRIVTIGLTEYGIEPDLPLVDQYCFKKPEKSSVLSQLIHAWVFARSSQPPLSKSALKSLHPFALTANTVSTRMLKGINGSVNANILTGDVSCTICSKSFALNDFLRSFPCNHVFHATCCADYAQLHSSCPICHLNLPTETDANSEWRFFHRIDETAPLIPQELAWTTENDIESILVGIALLVDRTSSQLQFFTLRKSLDSKHSWLDKAHPIPFRPSDAVVPVCAFTPTTTSIYTKEKKTNILSEHDMISIAMKKETMRPTTKKAAQSKLLEESLINQELQQANFDEYAAASIDNTDISGVDIALARFVLDPSEAISLLHDICNKCS